MNTSESSEMAMRRARMLAAFTSQWGEPHARYFAYFKDDDRDRVEVYSFMPSDISPIYRFVTIGASLQHQADNRSICWELLLSLPPDLAGADEQQVMRFIMDIVATSIGQNIVYAPRVVVPESPLSPASWKTRGFLFDEALAEPESVVAFDFGYQQVDMLWVVPIHTEETELLLEYGPDELYKRCQQLGWSPASPERPSVG